MIKKFSLVYFFMAMFFLWPAQYATAQVKKKAPKKTIIKTKQVDKKITKPVAVLVKTNPVRIKMSTDSGIIIVRLYDSTSIHRDNFVKLVQQGFYDSLLFHRVIPQFMIQGGDPTSKYAATGAILGNGGDNMSRLPAEIKTGLYHKKGVLAAARDGNPEKASSACQFYIVEGKTFSDDELNMIEQQKGKKYSVLQREMYKKIGGTPHLDGEYTVFGEVENGLEVIGKIANMPRDANNRPLSDIRMHIEILK